MSKAANLGETGQNTGKRRRWILPDTASAYIGFIRFSIPLSLVNLCIESTHVLFAMGLSRLQDSTQAIAAFSVSKNYAQVIETPSGIISSTVAALSTDPVSWRKTRNFVFGVLAFCFLLFFGLNITGTSAWILENVMGAKPEIVAKTPSILWVLTFLPVVMMIRNYCGGLLTLFKKNTVLLMGTITRWLFVFAMVFAITTLSRWVYGGVVAAIMFVAGGALELPAVFWGMKHRLGKIRERMVERAEQRRQEGETETKPVTYPKIMFFFFPLLFSNMLRTIEMPIINSFLNRIEGLQAAAVAVSSFEVGWLLSSMIFSMCSFIMTVPVVYGDNGITGKRVFRFSVGTGVFLSIVMFSLSLTHASHFLLERVIGADPSIIENARQVFLLGSFVPLIASMRWYNFGLICYMRKTYHVFVGRGIGLLFNAGAMMTLLPLFKANPALCGGTALCISWAMECVYYFIIAYFLRRSRRELGSMSPLEPDDAPTAQTEAAPAQ